MRFAKKIFLSIICVLCLLAPVWGAESNLPQNPGNIGNFGVFSTEENRALLLGSARQDLDGFKQGFLGNFTESGGGIKLKADFVPLEAKVGLALMGALSAVSGVIYDSLGGFIGILLVALFALWIMMEAYQTMQSGQDVKKLAYEIARKGMWVSIWFIILHFGPARLFMEIMGPIISAGTYMSDLILNAVTATVGVDLPDTCGAIKAYVAGNHIDNLVVSSEQAAKMLCVPTRLAGFFYTCVAAGFKWMAAGLGHSALTFFAGAVFVVIFAYNIWKFALQALGVVASMFIAVMLLPFTAVAECFSKGTTLQDEGLITQFFGMLTKMFGETKLDKQIMTFINAAIYFVVLSVVAAIGLALLGTVAKVDFTLAVPTIESNNSFMMVLICGALVAYLVNKAGQMAKDLGGSIEDSFGKQLGGDIKAIWGNTTKTVGGWWKALRKK